MTSTPPSPDYGDIRDSLLLERVDDHIWMWMPIKFPRTGALLPDSSSKLPSTPRGARGVFGGQVISQALLAITSPSPPTPSSTPVSLIPSDLSLHSLHCYFLLAASSLLPLVYQVTPLRVGRSFRTFSVSATQKSKVVFFLICSFKVSEPEQPMWAYPMPVGIKPPHQCMLSEERYRRMLDERDLPVGDPRRKHWEAIIEDRIASPIAIRMTGYEHHSNPTSHGAYWLKARGIKKGELDSTLQKAVLAYLSDFSFIGTAAKALGISTIDNPLTSLKDHHALGMMVSLDHSMWFYSNDFDASEWLLHVMNVSRGGDGRGTVHGRIYTQSGTLIAVTTQEGLVRAKLPSTSKL